MKPLHFFLASLLMLVSAGVSFNWNGSDKPIVIEVLGAIGIFFWLPLLIVAYVRSRQEK